MTSPAPSANIAGITLTAPTGSTTSSENPDLYGLGSVGNVNLDFGDLPGLTGPNGLVSGKNAPADAIIKAFATASPGTVAQIQRALYLGGFYGKTYVPQVYGVIQPQDIPAFTAAVKFAAQTQSGQAGGQPSTVADVLLTRAKIGAAAGISSARALQAQGQSSTQSVSVPNTADSENAAVQAFEQELGRKATPAEQAAFAASYRAMAVGIGRANNLASYNASVTASGDAGITAGQESTDATALGAVGSQQPIDTGNPQLNENLRDEGQSTTPEFGDQVKSLYNIANEVSQQAIPTAATAPGLTQVDQQQPESLSTAAQNFAQNADPQGADAHSMASQFNTFLSLLAGNLEGGVPGGE